MITLQLNKFLQNFVGFGGYEPGNSHLATRWVAFLTILMGSSFTTCSINVYFFFSNVKVVTELMFCAAIYVIIISSFYTVLTNREAVRSYFIKIQELTEQRAYYFQIR